MNTAERQPKFALITGGTRGIGYGIAKKLAESGHDMILGYSSNHERAEKVRSYAISLAPRRITCNCIIPGVTKSDAGVLVFGQGDEKKFEETAAKMCPMKAGIAPEDIGEAAAFLCSSKASFITGVNLDVDGGLRFRLR
ncbi:peroxisomal trans-2-enoyl-CoA reductase [Exaiptasia diaphana]|uniref:Uncharacterized protein n=1 Tax=Exaiptasia diaphana TaxID=2652724 RepID=A0A913Y866_EXADI|nr:peroxisomal trans-2-enoyl-CoA reductase [Exaiptasia diaphana]